MEKAIANDPDDIVGWQRLNREAGMAEPEARAIMARQWDPENNQSNDAPAWTRFVRQGEN